MRVVVLIATLQLFAGAFAATSPDVLSGYTPVIQGYAKVLLSVDATSVKVLLSCTAIGYAHAPQSVNAPYDGFNSTKDGTTATVRIAFIAPYSYTCMPTSTQSGGGTLPGPFRTIATAPHPPTFLLSPLQPTYAPPSMPIVDGYVTLPLANIYLDTTTKAVVTCTQLDAYRGSPSQGVAPISSPDVPFDGYIASKDTAPSNDYSNPPITTASIKVRLLFNKYYVCSATQTSVGLTSAPSAAVDVAYVNTVPMPDPPAVTSSGFALAPNGSLPADVEVNVTVLVAPDSTGALLSCWYMYYNADVGDVVQSNAVYFPPDFNPSTVYDGTTVIKVCDSVTFKILLSSGKNHSCTAVQAVNGKTSTSDASLAPVYYVATFAADARPANPKASSGPPTCTAPPAPSLPYDPNAVPGPDTCLAPPPVAFTSYYTIRCPPPVEISRLSPVNVTGVPSPVCGVRMPDLRHMIQGDWLNGVSLTQSPPPGQFLPPPLPTPPEGDWAAYPAQLVQSSFSPVLVTMSINNPTGAGPRGSCTFPVHVSDAGPPLCAASCPPPLYLVPKPPGVCRVPLPDAMADLRPPPPACMRPYPATPAKYSLTVAPSDPSYPGQAANPSPLNATSSTRWAVDAVVRHANYPSPTAASCPVRFALYYAGPPAFSPAARPEASTLADAVPASTLNASTVHAVPFSFSPGSAEPCGAQDEEWLARFCRRAVRVETPDGRPSDVGASGNFTFRPDVAAWSFAPGNFTSGLAVSRLVPDSALACPAPGSPGSGGPYRVLRTYRLTLSCAFNKGVPKPPPNASGSNPAGVISMSISHPSWIVQVKAPPCP